MPTLCDDDLEVVPTLAQRLADRYEFAAFCSARTEESPGPFDDDEDTLPG